MRGTGAPDKVYTTLHGTPTLERHYQLVFSNSDYLVYRERS